MAQRFYEEATQQLAPVYQQTENALQAQLPAIQNLYQTLYQGLEGQRATETQNILESASSRGVLRSSLPVDLQTSLGQALLAERGKLGAQEASDVAGVREKIGTLGINRTSAIADLARALETQDLARQELELKKLESERNYQLARSSAGGGGALGALVNKLTGGNPQGTAATGGGIKVPPALQELFNQVFINPAGGEWSNRDLVNDYNATLKSARYGNTRDKQKIELYHSVRPDLFGPTIPAAVLANANQVGF